MLLKETITIVKNASKLMLDNHFEISQKDGFSNIVTSSDLAVQDYLCEKLALLLPESGFFCEENDLQNSTHEYTWIIDPIDGTTNYSRHIDECAICVGLKYKKEMQLGVVYLPFKDELYYAEKDKGAFMNDTPIHVSDKQFQDGILCTALAVYHKDKVDICSKIIVEFFLQCNDIRRFGACAPELCYLGVHKCDLYFEYLLSPWDFAAASIILTEAGGVISDLEGKPLTFDKPSGVLAANNQDNLVKLLNIVQKHNKIN